MKGTVQFRYDAVNDVVIATVRWRIETEEELQAWYGLWCTYMQQFGRKMDCILVVDELSLGPKIGARWGEYRAKVHKQFVRYNYRVHPSSQVKLFVNTSSVRYDISREEAATVEDAIEGIKAQRRLAATGG